MILYVSTRLAVCVRAHTQQKQTNAACEFLWRSKSSCLRAGVILASWTLQILAAQSPPDWLGAAPAKAEPPAEEAPPDWDMLLCFAVLKRNEKIWCVLSVCGEEEEKKKQAELEVLFI